MRYFEDEISGIDGSTATFVGYCLDNSSEIDPNRKRPSVLVIPGGGYEMTSDREKPNQSPCNSLQPASTRSCCAIP